MLEGRIEVLCGDRGLVVPKSDLGEDGGLFGDPFLTFAWHTTSKPIERRLTAGVGPCSSGHLR